MAIQDTLSTAIKAAIDATEAQDFQELDPAQDFWSDEMAKAMIEWVRPGWRLDLNGSDQDNNGTAFEQVLFLSSSSRAYLHNEVTLVSNEIVAPADGVYHSEVYVHWQNAATASDNMRIKLDVTGAEEFRSSQESQGGSENQNLICDFIALEGQAIRISAANFTAGGRGDIDGTITQTFWTGHYVGGLP